MRILSGPRADRMVKHLASRGTTLTALEPRVRHIIKNVRRDGDRALRRYSERWDALPKSQPLRVSDDETGVAWKELPSEARKSLRHAAENIRRFCQWQKPR